MRVDWEEQWMSFEHNGATITLTSTNSSHFSVTVVELMLLHEPQDNSIQLPEEVRQILKEYESVFAEPVGLPPRRLCDHFIPLIPGAQPINKKPYRYTPQMKDEIEKQIKEMLTSGVIRISTSAFSSPLILVKKKDHTWRPVVDYRHLNALTVKSKYPVPVIDELLDELAGSCWFSKLDLRAGYHQIRMAPGEEFKTAFSTHQGQYEFTVMAFGLTGAPATFLSAMNDTLKEFLRKFVLVFFDDILIYSTSYEKHLMHIDQVLNKLRENHWQVKMSKCVFAQTSIAYLGHVISSEGVSTDPAKVETVRDWPSPTSVKELRSFLGLSGYYRKFVKNYGVIAKPLTNLLRKGVVYAWTTDTECAFQTLKQALITAPVLSLPDFSKTFTVETDASDTGIGAVLTQDGHPLAFVSKALGPRTRGLSTYEKEHLAILMAVDHWRPYLQSGEFRIVTDQRSLSHLQNQHLHTTWQHKALTKMLGLHYSIVYRKGSENTTADALSRKNKHPSSLAAISTVQPVWIDDVIKGYQNDPKALELLAKLAVTPAGVDGYILKDGIIRQKGRIWLGFNPKLQSQVTLALHASAAGGHSGFPVTYRRVKQLFIWPLMKQFVKRTVQECLICQRAKPERVRYPGLLQPLPVPNHAWEIVSMDFISGFPKSGRFDGVLVVVDKFSRFAHFIPIAHPYTAATVARLFLDNIYKLHSMPVSIISDRDRIFTSAFWTELCRLTDTQLRMSSSYHPQTDGQTERVHQSLEAYLRCFAQACPSRWAQWLSLAEYWYNTSWHTSLNKSPFEVLYNYHPRHFGLVPADACHITELQDWLNERSAVTELLKQQLLRVQHKMKQSADKKRVHREFEPGDMVFLKLQPYIQNSVVVRPNQKLAYKYFGPYRVLARVGKVA
jgi:transposase InsO family protein